MIRPRLPTTSQTMTSSKSNVGAVSGSRRASFGMTLIELLVVVAILGTLAVTVLPSFGTTTESRRSQEAARVLSSFLSKTHSAAIGQSDWAGFSIAPLSPTSTYATDVYAATVPQPYRGFTLDATIAVQPGTAVERLALGASACPIINGSNAVAVATELLMISGTAGDLVRFDGTGPFYELVALVSNGFTFEMRDSAGQSVATTPWPAESPITHSFEIFRQPGRSGTPQVLPGSRVIDLKWSGFGPPSDYQRFNTPGETISVLFDGTGRLRHLVRGSTRYALSRSVFFLVGRADRAQQDPAPLPLSANDDSVGANWQYSDSWWVVIDPLSGIVRSAQCKPNVATVTESQEFVRNGLL